MKPEPYSTQFVFFPRKDNANPFLNASVATTLSPEIIFSLTRISIFTVISTTKPECICTSIVWFQCFLRCRPLKLLLQTIRTGCLLDRKCEVHFLQGMQSCSDVAFEIPRATENPEVRCIISGFYLLSASEALQEGDIQVLDVSGAPA